MAEAYPVAAAEPPVVAPLTLTEAETAQVDALYEELKPAATAGAREYVLARTPANLQVAMGEKIDADWPLPEGAEDPGTMVRTQGEQGRVSVQKPAISDKSPQVAHAGKNRDEVAAEIDTGGDANRRRVSP